MNDINNKRMLSEKEGQNYTSLGRTTFREFAAGIGAVHRIGRRVLYDRTVIDAYFDKQKR
jgi:hypothetical protein